MASRRRWKCDPCQKILSSKQTAVKHVQIYHKESNPLTSISKVTVQTLGENQKSVAKPKEKRKAYNYFSKLESMFNDDSMMEKFSLSQSKKSTSKGFVDSIPNSSNNNEPVPSTSPSSSTQETRSLVNTNENQAEQRTVNQNRQNHNIPNSYEVLASGLTSPTSLTQQNIGAVETVSSRETVLDDLIDTQNVFPDVSIDQDVSDLDTRDEFGEEETTFNLLFRGSSLGSKPKDIEVNQFLIPNMLNQTFYDLQPAPVSTNVEVQVMEPAGFPINAGSHIFKPNQRNIQPISRNSKSVPSAISKTFKVPYKTRGHCGDQDCSGCNREPCGLCQNCIHKKERRQRCELRICEVKNKKVRIRNQKQSVVSVSETAHKTVTLGEPVETVEQGKDLINELDSNGDSGPGEEDSDNDLVSTNIPEEGQERVKSLSLYKCEKCGRRFAKKPYALKCCKPKATWKCNMCGKEIKQAGNVKRHQASCPKIVKPKIPRKVVKEIENLKCNECDKDFSSMFNLLRHRVKVHHLVTFNKIVCPVQQCPFSTNGERQMNRHVKMSHSSKNVKCKKCDYVCLSISGLRKHMINIHGIECKTCFKLFSTSSQLEVHVNVEHDGKEVTTDNSDQIIVCRRIGEHASHLIPNNPNAKENSGQISDNADSEVVAE